MITLKQITNQYYVNIPAKIRRQINTWIAESEPQRYIKIALGYELSDQDYKDIFALGQAKNSKYPRLYYLCCIYIHPLTVAQHIIANYKHFI